MDAPKTKVDWRVLSAALGLSFVFGSIHSFAVLLPALEGAFQTSRASVSLVYSFAIISLTSGVYLYPRISAFWSARQIALFVGIFGAFGLMLPVLLPSLISLYIGYGVLFGFANGVAYMLFLEQARFALKPNEGFAVGLATAFYGLGSAGYAMVLALTLRWASLQVTWDFLAISVALAGMTGFFVMSKVPQKAVIRQIERKTQRFFPNSLTLKLWTIYFLSAFGGLMVIVHSAEIVLSHWPASTVHLYSPAINALGNILGCIIGGWLTDKFSARTALAMSQILAMISGILLILNLSIGVDLIAIALIGLCYGALISIMPIAVLHLVGEMASADVFKRVFTAWGAAGLLGPFLAGLMYDNSGGYDIAIVFSCVLASVSLVLVYFLDQLKSWPKK